MYSVQVAASKTDRKQIIGAAMELLAHGGLRSVSVRSVAAQLDLAPNALYHYFADVEDIKAAIAAEVAARLHVVLEKAVRGKTADRAIRAIAAAYMAFAREQHLLYEALLVPRPATGPNAIAPEMLWLFFVGQVRRITGEPRAPQAAVALWAMLHGMAALESVGAFNEQIPSTGFEFGLDAWMDASRAVQTRNKRRKET